MSFLTYQCDGCGTITNAQSPPGWRTLSPTGPDDQRFRNTPVHSHLCAGCLSVAMQAVHSRVLEPVQVHSARSDTAEMVVIDASWTIA